MSDKPNDVLPEMNDFNTPDEPKDVLPEIQYSEDTQTKTESQDNKTEKKKGKLFKLEKRNKKEHKGLPKRNDGKKLKPWQIVLIVIAALFVIGLISFLVMYFVNREDISDYTYTMKEKTQIISSDDVVIAEIYTENRTYVSLDQIPQDAINALIATEDARFYDHSGVDYFGIIRSLLYNITNSAATGQGASTITQQVARTIFLPSILTEKSFLDSLNRKFKEISIARQMESRYTKEQILEMYFNETFFGSAAYGIEEAAKTYFGKHISECNLAECAMLAGLPQSPSAFAPNVDFEAAKARQLQVLTCMVERGYIDQATADEAYNTEITIAPWSPNDMNNQVPKEYQAFVNRALQEYAVYQAPSVMKDMQMSEDEAIDFIRSDLAGGGYKIYTTIDTRFQNAGVNAVDSVLSSFGDPFTGVFATTSLSGAIKSYYGGSTDVDMANNPRQPGSGIKPLYYSYGIEKGLMTFDSTVVDERTDFGGWVPRNFYGNFNGTVTYRQALYTSLNIPAAKLYRDIGPENAVAWMKTFGITTFTDTDTHLAVSLGGMTNGIKPYEMAAAYNVFNNSGVYNQPYFVEEIKRSNGDQVYEKSMNKWDTHQVMSEDTAKKMWDTLRLVVTSGAATSAACGVDTSGKTGTTDDSKDLWFNGMTANYTTSIWTGSPSGEPIGYSGGEVAARIYGNMFRVLVNSGAVQ